jgi:hypothetical protein
MDAVAHFRQCGSPFQGHVERDVPGIDWGSGNLGQGLSAGVGFALAQKARKNGKRTYVLMGDGGQTKGQGAEARRIAVKENLANLTALVDWNHIQISGTLETVMPADIPALWKADGWNVLECDGHSFRELYAALRLSASCDRPATRGPGVCLGARRESTTCWPSTAAPSSANGVSSAMPESGIGSRNRAGRTTTGGTAWSAPPRPPPCRGSRFRASQPARLRLTRTSGRPSAT